MTGLAKGKILNRPWMVKFSISLQSEELIVCSGSLLNRRWIISAAHCFCALYEVSAVPRPLLSQLSPILQFADCTQRERGFNKIFSQESQPGHGMKPENLADRISVIFGTTSYTRTYAETRELEVETVMVHPDYWEDQTEAGGNNYDLALIKMNKVPVWHLLSTSLTDHYLLSTRISTMGKAITFPTQQQSKTGPKMNM